jgi:hypothetical protein
MHVVQRIIRYIEVFKVRMGVLNLFANVRKRGVNKVLFKNTYYNLIPSSAMLAISPEIPIDIK